MAKLKVKPMKNKQNSHLKFGLFLKSTVVGFFLAAPLTSGTLEINDLNLDPEYKGLGYDLLLLEKAREYAAESGLQQISLEIPTQKFSFYQNHGFVKTGETLTRNGVEYIRITREA